MAVSQRQLQFDSTYSTNFTNNTNYLEERSHQNESPETNSYG